MARSKSTITIYEGVPFDVTANNVRMFENQAEQSAYFEKFTQRHFAGSYQRVSPEGGGMTRAPYLADDIVFYNYIKVENTDGAKDITWYGFIENVEYISGDESLGKGVSHIQWSVDVGMTFLQPFDDNRPTIKGTVVRGHVNRYEPDDYTPNTLIQTVNEPIQAPSPIYYNAESIPFQDVSYTTKKGEKVTYTNASVQWVVIGVMPKDITTSGSYMSLPMPFDIYVLPIHGAWSIDLHADKWGNTNAVDVTNNHMAWTDIADKIAKDDTFSGTSGNIVFEYLIPYLGIPQTIGVNSAKDEFTATLNWFPEEDGTITGDMFTVYGDDYKLLKLNFIPEFLHQTVTIDPKGVFHYLYGKLNDYYHGESKLLTAPFTTLEINNGKGDFYEYNPQEFVNGNGTNPDFVLNRRGAIGQAPKQHYQIDNYRTQEEDTRIYPLSTQHGYIDTDDTSLPFEYDQMVQFMANHKNSIRQSRQTAKLNYAQGMAGLDTQQKNLNVQINAGASQLSNDINMAKQSSIASRAQNALAGMPAINDSKLGQLSAPMIQQRGFQNQVADMKIGNESAKAQNQNSYNTQANINAQNRDNALASIQAGLRDTANNSNNLGQLGGSIGFDFGNNNYQNYLIVKALPEQAVRGLVQQFQRFGYMYGYYVDNFWSFATTRESFNFVQYADIEVYGNLPVAMQKLIKQMLGSGVTFWHTDNMYNITQSNNERN
jgi:hypothetical protein